MFWCGHVTLVCICAFMFSPFSSAENRDCVHVFDASKGMKGNFTSPNYPNSYPPDTRCVFYFRAPSDRVVRIRWHRFNLEEPFEKNHQCLRDFVNVIVIDYRNVQHVSKRFCGNTLPHNYDTLQQAVNVIFQSSLDAKQFQGFSGEWEFTKEENIAIPMSHYPGADDVEATGCGGYASELNEHGGVITSPGYPFTYPANVECNWLIRVKPGLKVFVKVDELELTNIVGSCDHAGLTLVDGYAHYLEDDEAKLPRNQRVAFCGQKRMFKNEGDRSYVSERNRLLVQFKTSKGPMKAGINESKMTGSPLGFKIIWTAVQSDGDQGNLACNKFLCKGAALCIDEGPIICAYTTQYCIDKSLVCDGIYHCSESDYSDEENCNTAEVVGLAVCGAGLVILILIGCCFWQCRRRRALKEHQEQQQEPQSPNDGPSSSRQQTIDGARTSTSMQPLLSVPDTHDPPGGPYAHQNYYKVRDADEYAKEPFISQNHVGPPSVPVGAVKAPPHFIRGPILPVYANVDSPRYGTPEKGPYHKLPPPAYHMVHANRHDPAPSQLKRIPPCPPPPPLQESPAYVNRRRPEMENIIRRRIPQVVIRSSSEGYDNEPVDQEPDTMDLGPPPMVSSFSACNQSEHIPLAPKPPIAPRSKVGRSESEPQDLALEMVTFNPRPILKKSSAVVSHDYSPENQPSYPSAWVVAPQSRLPDLPETSQKLPNSSKPAAQPTVPTTVSYAQVQSDITASRSKNRPPVAPKPPRPPDGFLPTEKAGESSRGDSSFRQPQRMVQFCDTPQMQEFPSSMRSNSSETNSPEKSPSPWHHHQDFKPTTV